MASAVIFGEDQYDTMKKYRGKTKSIRPIKLPQYKEMALETVIVERIVYSLQMTEVSMETIFGKRRANNYLVAERSKILRSVHKTIFSTTRSWL